MNFSFQLMAGGALLICCSGAVLTRERKGTAWLQLLDCQQLSAQLSLASHAYDIKIFDKSRHKLSDECLADPHGGCGCPGQNHMRPQ